MFSYMRLSEGNPFKTCANPQAHNQKLNRANRYENEMVYTYRDLNCSGASPIKKAPPRNAKLSSFVLLGSRPEKVFPRICLPKFWAKFG